MMPLLELVVLFIWYNNRVTRFSKFHSKPYQSYVMTRQPRNKHTTTAVEPNHQRVLLSKHHHIKESHLTTLLSIMVSHQPLQVLLLFFFSIIYLLT